MSCHELYGYTCQYKFSTATVMKECYHSFYCWRESSFLIHTNAGFPLLLTKHGSTSKWVLLQILYYSTVNIWLSLLLSSQLSKDDFTLIMLLYRQVRKTDFQIFALLKGWMALFLEVLWYTRVHCPIAGFVADFLAFALALECKTFFGKISRGDLDILWYIWKLKAIINMYHIF